MANANLQAFIAQIMKDSSLQDQLKDLTDKAQFTQTMLSLGKSKGLTFTAQDVEATLFQAKINPLEELSDADLSLVAGGARPKATSDGCGGAWTTLFGWC